jgi:PPOX class probable F420-dependent enzyme
MALQYKVFDRARHRRAFEVAREPGTAHDFAHFRGARQALLVTFKRSGEPVPTPVNFGLSDDGKLYFRSEPHVAKIKRLKRDPHVRVGPCNLRGKPKGPMVEARARVLSQEESDRAQEVVSSNWRPETRLVEWTYDRIGVPEVYVEITPVGRGGSASRASASTSPSTA